MTDPVVSLVLPMYNEAAVIAEVLAGLASLFAEECRHLNYEIVVVDDGSTDESAAVVNGVANPQVRLVRHPYNMGNGAAVKTGIRQAQGEYILLMDADGQHQVGDIARLLELMGEYDLVVGARGGDSETAVHRNLANHLYNLFASYVCGRRIEDLTSGLRLIRADLARSIVFLLPNTFSYPTTMTLAVVRGGYTLHYVPITVRRRVGRSKIRLLRDGSRFFLIILKIATLFSPLKVFIPASLFMFLLGFGYGLFKVVVLDSRYGPTSAMLMTMSVMVFLIGLVSEQITQLRFDRSVAGREGRS